LGVRFKVPLALKAAAVGHFLVIFEKSPVAFEVQNIRVKSPIIQAEFEIRRNSTTTLSAVAKHPSAQMDQEATENGEMR
jgi:hypothetical protein